MKNHLMNAYDEFQSLLSQGISLLTALKDMPMYAENAFQSLLSQGISLLGRCPSLLRPEGRRRFNPFLVRASVYCEEGASPHDIRPKRRFNPFLVRASVYCMDKHPALLHMERRAGFNPFLVRASVYCVHARLYRRQTKRSLFQSLLSQGISLLENGRV